jgi:thymidylate synthase
MVEILKSMNNCGLQPGSRISAGYISLEFDAAHHVPFMNLKSIRLDEIIQETLFLVVGGTFEKKFSRRWKCFENEKYLKICSDQIQNMLTKLKSRKAFVQYVLTFTNLIEVEKSRFMPDISNFHFLVRKNKLDMVVSQIRCNFVSDGPACIAQIAVFLYLFAHIGELQPGRIIWNCSEVFTDAGGAHSVENMLKSYKSVNFPRLVVDGPRDELKFEHIKVFKNTDRFR